MRRVVTFTIVICSVLACGHPRSKKKPDMTEEYEPQEENGDMGLGGMDGFDSTLTNLPSLLKTLNLEQAHRRGSFGQGVTIAVLDNGYAGLGSSLGTRLPPDLVVEAAPKNKPADVAHGTKMAELAYAVATGSVTYSESRPGPKLLLYNTNGYTNLVHAIDEVIRRKVDIVLYAQIWEWGGNGDGEGFINAEVNRATDAGILWVNAAGNYGKSTFSGPIELGIGNYTVLPHQRRYLRLSLEEPTAVKMTLGWNDFTDSTDYQTNQDLDFEVYRADDGTKIDHAGEVQNPAGMRKGTTGQRVKFARETTQKPLNAGEYLVSIKARSNNFSRGSRMWFAVNGANVSVLDKGQNNSIFMPADNPNVLTVGAYDVDFSSSRPLSFGPAKPELVSVSTVHFDDGQTFAGTSAASAITVGALATISSYGYGKLSRAKIIELLRSRRLSTNSYSLGPARPEAPMLRLAD